MHILCSTALILSIVGGVELSIAKANGQKTGQTLAKAGILMFLAVLIILIGVAILTAPHAKTIPTPEKRILLAVLLSFPFLAVRLAYSMIVTFGNSKRFSLRSADPIVQLCMSTLEELAVVLLFIVVGLLAPRSGSGPAAQSYNMVPGRHSRSLEESRGENKYNQGNSVNMNHQPYDAGSRV